VLIKVKGRSRNEKDSGERFLRNTERCHMGAQVRSLFWCQQIGLPSMCTHWIPKKLVKTAGFHPSCILFSTSEVQTENLRFLTSFQAVLRLLVWRTRGDHCFIEIVI
jgi:hypothetical protein